jgi:RNA polymerase sigma-70 factor (ECF subfamily)
VSEADSARAVDEAEVGRIFRQEFGRSVATLIRVFGDVEAAEDAVQDAFTVAMRKWPSEGLPPNPGGWITTTARNRAIDRLRRESRERELLGEVAILTPDDSSSAAEVGGIPDDRLRLIFTCCHPALCTEAQVALTLRLLGGLSTARVADSFLITESAMAQRLARAKRKIKAARVPYRVPEDHELPNRLQSVLAVVYLIYNAGLGTPAGAELCPEAIRLARLLATLMPDEPEVAGLLGLLLLTESRRKSRIGPDGSLVVLGEQDRSRWDRDLIAEGQAIIRWCLRRNRPGAYQIQAAINAVHADAATASRTDWSQILALYDQLLMVAPTPVVALNRVIAVGEVHGAAAALALLEGLDLKHYYAFHATRADLLRRLGRDSDAATEYERAAAMAPTSVEREFLAKGGRGTAERGPLQAAELGRTRRTDAARYQW